MATNLARPESEPSTDTQPSNSVASGSAAPASRVAIPPGDPPGPSRTVTGAAVTLSDDQLAALVAQVTERVVRAQASSPISTRGGGPPNPATGEAQWVPYYS